MGGGEPFAQVVRLDSRGRGDRSRAGSVIALLVHLGFGLWAGGWTANFPPSARAETEPIPVSVEDVLSDSSSSAGGGGEPGSQGGSGESAPPLRREESRAARGTALPIGRAPKAPQPRAPKAKADPIDDPFSKWLFGLPVVSSPDGARTGGRGGEADGVHSGTGREGGSAGGGGNAGAGTSSGGGRARGAHLLAQWDCEFPGGGNPGALVRMIVTVRPDGTAAATEILSDPGHGFAEIARECAMRARFLPARDGRGLPVLGKTGPFNVRFLH